MNFLKHILPLFFVAIYDGECGNWSKLPDNCGSTRFTNRNTRIISGAKAGLGQFPWIVRLGMMISNQLQFICGASLISSLYVLSAAHCDDQCDIARIGENSLTSEKDCDETGDCAPHVQDIKIKRYIFEDFCRLTFDNDLMLAELETPARFNEYVQPICLPQKPLIPKNFLGQAVMISGFGVIHSINREQPKHLMYVSNSIVPPEACQIVPQNQQFDNSRFCIGPPGMIPTNGTCFGDSGGPVAKLLDDDRGSRWHLLGVVSYGHVICELGPKVYTNPSYYAEWILEHMGENQLHPQ